MPGKPITEQGLEKDLSYILQGTAAHQVFAVACPPKAGIKVLEPGCGSGKFGLSYAAAGAEVVLMDIDDGVLDYARALQRKLEAYLGRNLCVTILQGNLHRLVVRFGRNRFDYVLNEGLAHHWSDWRRQSCLNQMVAVTKPGGVVCTMCSNALCPVMLDYANRIEHTYEGMPPHQQPLHPEELAARLARAGLDSKSIFVAPVGTDSWEDSMLIAGWGRKP